MSIGSRIRKVVGDRESLPVGLHGSREDWANPSEACSAVLAVSRAEAVIDVDTESEALEAEWPQRAPDAVSRAAIGSWGQCYKTFYGHNLRIFIVS